MKKLFLVVLSILFITATGHAQSIDINTNQDQEQEQNQAQGQTAQGGASFSNASQSNLQQLGVTFNSSAPKKQEVKGNRQFTTPYQTIYPQIPLQRYDNPPNPGPQAIQLQNLINLKQALKLKELVHLANGPKGSKSRVMRTSFAPTVKDKKKISEEDLEKLIKLRILGEFAKRAGGTVNAPDANIRGELEDNVSPAAAAHMLPVAAQSEALPMEEIDGDLLGFVVAKAKNDKMDSISLLAQASLSCWELGAAKTKVVGLGTIRILKSSSWGVGFNQNYSMIDGATGNLGGTGGGGTGYSSANAAYAELVWLQLGCFAD